MASDRKARRFRWSCEAGHAGVLAPSRLRRDDVRRFCWPCSVKAGVLVERSCPTLENRRVARKLSAKERAVAKKEREQRKHQERVSYDGVDLERELAVLWALPCARHVAASRVVPRLHVRRCSRKPYSVDGRAWPWEGRIQVSISDGADLARVLGTLVHEVAHILDYASNGYETVGKRRILHGDAFHAIMAELLLDGYGEQGPPKAGYACCGFVGESGQALARERSGVS